MNVLLDGGMVLINNWKLMAGILVFFIFITTLPFFRFRFDPKSASTSKGIVPALFIILSLLLRLAYVSRALFPSYFDSAHHYQIIKNILSNGPMWVFTMFHTDYYHTGFHFLAAFFTSVFDMEITTTMLILGQVTLAVLPIIIFYIVKRMTRSSQAGVFATLLSAFGWYMPAHAVDWGKYPALMSMAMILFVINLAHLYVQNRNEMSVGRRNFLLGILGMSILFAFFVHSRSLIVLGIIGFAWIASGWWEKRPRIQKHLLFVLLLLTLIVGVIFIWRIEVLSLLFDPYLKKGIVVTFLVILLSVFAYESFPHLIFASILTICLLLVSLFVPVRGVIPGYDHLTLMDRPFVEIVLFIPLSLLGGLGLAGLEKRVRNSKQRFVVFLGIGLVLIHAIANNEFYPSECCVIVGNDDVASIAWIEDQLPFDARIGIASTGLKVIAEDVIEGDVGTDAGIWITPLTNRATILLPHDLDFDQQTAMNMICRNGVEYIFVGQLGRTFNNAGLNSRPAWYRPLLSMPGTRVYKVTGCADV